MAGNRKVEKKRSGEKEKILSAEKYRKTADEHMNTVKDTWKLLGKTGIFVLAAVIAVLILGIAWFVSNNKVQVEGMRIRSAGSDFELAAQGKDVGKWDSEFLSEVTVGDEVTIDEKLFMVTDNSRNSISWAVDDSSNMGNDTGKGINPGSKGELTFYIVSKKEGTLTVSLNLVFTGLTSENGTLSQEAQQLLEGHLLMFAGYDEMQKAYRGWISKDADPWNMTLSYQKKNGESISASLTRDADGMLTWVSDVEKGQVYPITIYWIWPEVYGEYLFRDQTYLGNRPVLFPKDSTYSTDTSGEQADPEVLPSKLFETMRFTDSESTSNRYFKWALDSDTEDVKNKSKTEFSSLFPEENPDLTLSEIREGNVNTIIYGKLCSYYNMADQYLGENVPYVKLELNAQ